MDQADLDELLTKFKLVCNKCGNSDQVVAQVTAGINYGGMTGYIEGTVSVGCNHCKDNDFYCSQ